MTSGIGFRCPQCLVSGVFRIIIGCSCPHDGPPTNYGQKIGHPKLPFVILKPLNSNYGHYASARNRRVIILKGASLATSDLHFVVWDALE